MTMADDYIMKEDAIARDAKWRRICGGLFALGVLGLTGVLVYLGLQETKLKNGGSGTPLITSPSTLSTSTASPSTTTLPPPIGTRFNSYWGEYKSAAVAAETYECSQVGVDILKNKQGSAVDAAIATLLCVGATNFHSCGIGGGFFMTLYNSTGKEAEALMARETAPGAATTDMFVGDTTKASLYGGKAVGVPNELAGYRAAWEKYGKLPWADLFQPAIKLCREGFVVSESLEYAIGQTNDPAKARQTLIDMITKADGSEYKKGDMMQRPTFANTLETIATEGASAFYSGSLAQDIVDDITDEGGIITSEDLANVTTPWVTPVSMTLENGGYTVYSLPPPSSGVVVNFILSILDGYNFDKDAIEDMDATVLSYHRMVEAMKFGFGKRSALGDAAKVDVEELKGNMSDPAFAKKFFLKIRDDKTMPLNYYEPNFEIVQDSGTTHLSIVDADGNAVSVTSTINTYFGSGVLGSRTGVVFNNEMDDFSTPGAVNYFGVPASATNYIEPGKRPMSSMSPAVVVDGSGELVLVLGASGGTRIINTIIQNFVRDLWFGQDFKTSTDLPRIHNQLLPNDTYYEIGISQELLDGLKGLGHKVTPRPGLGEIGTLQGVRLWCPPCAGTSCTLKCLQAVSDGRKGGRPDGY